LQGGSEIYFWLFCLFLFGLFFFVFLLFLVFLFLFFVSFICLLLKGVLDSGIKVAHDPSILPEDSDLISEKTSEAFKKLKEKIL